MGIEGFCLNGDFIFLIVVPIGEAQDDTYVNCLK